jgi:triosephosphate isomerase
MPVKKRLFFGGNWKADKTPTQARQFMEVFAPALREKGLLKKLAETGSTVMLGAPAACLTGVRSQLGDVADVVKLGVQDPWIKAGAFTGATTFEVAADPTVAAEYAIIGHSETREPWRTIEQASKNVWVSLAEEQYMSHIPKWFRDILLSSMADEVVAVAGIASKKPGSFRIALDPIVNQAVKTSLANGITPILCVGETLEERETGRTGEVVDKQVNLGLANLSVDDIKRMIVAYEPVWAIGTGKTATPEQAQEVHARIAHLLMKHTQEAQNIVPIIYGGSMKPDNVAELVSRPDIWGGLIGGASLKPDVFLALIENGLAAIS